MCSTVATVGESSFAEFASVGATTGVKIAVVLWKISNRIIRGAIFIFEKLIVEKKMNYLPLNLLIFWMLCCILYKRMLFLLYARANAYEEYVWWIAPLGNGDIGIWHFCAYPYVHSICTWIWNWNEANTWCYIICNSILWSKFKT